MTGRPSRRRRARAGRIRALVGELRITWDDASQGPSCTKASSSRHRARHSAERRWYCWHASRRQAMVESVWKKFGASLPPADRLGEGPRLLNALALSSGSRTVFLRLAQGQQAAASATDYPAPLDHPDRQGRREDRPSEPRPRSDRGIRPADAPARAAGQVCFEPFSGSARRSSPASRPAGASARSDQSGLVDVAVKRWRPATGRPAVLEGRDEL